MKNDVRKETKGILRKCSFDIVLKIIISICYRGSLLIIPIVWGKAVDYVTVHDFPSAYRLIIISIGIMLFYHASVSLNQIIYYKLYNNMYKRYSKLAYSAFIKNSIYSISRFDLGEFNNIINNDITIIVAFFSDLILRIMQILEFLIIYYYFYTINITMFIVTVIASLATIALLLVLNIKTKKLNDVTKKRLDEKTTITHEVFNTVKEIKGLYIFKSINDRVKENCGRYLKANANLNSYSTIIKQVVIVLIEMSRYSLVAYGIYLFSVGKMEIGTILVVYSYYTKITENYDIIGTTTTAVSDVKVSLNRFNKLIEYRTEDEYDFVDKKIYSGKIKFEDVLYGNRKDPILNHVSFIIKENTLSVITGPTGSGKTGILDLLMKMNKKHKGYIFIDDVPYENIDNDTYYNLISLVRKEPNFFDMSIKDNLMLISNNFNEVKDICQKLGIHDDILELKNGYNTEINNINSKISLNLKRGIAIARILLKNSKIIMFDEIVDTLEPSLQNRVLDILEELKKDHTIIIISREDNIINKADKIIRLDNNKIKGR